MKRRDELEALARRVRDMVMSRLRALAAWLLALFGRERKPGRETYEIEISGLDISPGQAALEELARIDALGLVEKGLIDDLYTLVSEVLRRYIERKYGVLAMEMPTSHILREMGARGVMAICFDRVREVLEECDLVKFARYGPPDDAVASIVSRARGIVRATSGVGTGSAALEAR